MLAAAGFYVIIADIAMFTEVYEKDTMLLF
jgi:hypothetical protein